MGLHGGVAIYLKTGERWKERRDLVDMSENAVFECAAVEGMLGNCKTIILSVYRSPTTPVQSFLAKMEDILIRIFNENDQFFLAGDFNINIMDNSKCSVDFISLLYSFDMNPSISECTRISGTSASCIDNIFTNSQDFISEVLSC